MFPRGCWYELRFSGSAIHKTLSVNETHAWHLDLSTYIMQMEWAKLNKTEELRRNVSMHQTLTFNHVWWLEGKKWLTKSSENCRSASLWSSRWITPTQNSLQDNIAQSAQEPYHRTRSKSDRAPQDRCIAHLFRIETIMRWRSFAYSQFNFFRDESVLP